MATFTGSNSAEIIPDLIIGPVQGIGNDFVDALGGDDVAIGWSGDDVIRGGAGADVIIGGLLNAAGIITLSGIDAADYTTSVDGVTIDLSVLISLTLPILGINIQLTGASQGFGGDAQGDYLVGIVNLIGSNTGGDNLSGSAAANTMNGQGGNDTLNGQGGNDILLGGAADDILIGGGGADSLQGGAGSNDTADYSGSASPVTVNLTTGTGTGGDAQGDTLTGIERVIGSAGDDTLTGSAGNDTLIGGAGADALTGNGGVDTADYSGSGAGVTVDLTAGTGLGGDAQGDTLNGIENITGTAFIDTLTGDAGANTILGLDGNDTIRGGAGADNLDGGASTDMVDYFTSGSGVTVNLADNTASGGDAAGDTIINFEWIRGSEFVDNLTGSAGGNMISGEGGDDTINGGAGNDALFGEAGSDTIDGGDGDDRLVGGAGADSLTGGAGHDTVYYDDALAGVTLNLGNIAVNTGDAAGDTYSGIEAFAGSNFNDVMIGDSEANLLSGWGGDDQLSGGAGKDQLFGGAGTDVITGGAGSDTLRGGGDPDTFVYTAASDSGVGYANADLIADFSPGEQIDLSAITGGSGSFIGSAAFSHEAGEVRAVSAGGQTSIFVDVDGNGVADMQIRLSGTVALTASDFVL